MWFYNWFINGNNNMNRHISKYQLCNDCHKKFKLSAFLQKVADKGQKIYCPYCHSTNVYSIAKNQNI